MTPEMQEKIENWAADAAALASGLYALTEDDDWSDSAEKREAVRELIVLIRGPVLNLADAMKANVAAQGEAARVFFRTHGRLPKGEAEWAAARAALDASEAACASAKAKAAQADDAKSNRDTREG